MRFAVSGVSFLPLPVCYYIPQHFSYKYVIVIGRLKSTEAKNKKKKGLMNFLVKRQNHKIC